MLCSGCWEGVESGEAPFPKTSNRCLAHGRSTSARNWIRSPAFGWNARRPTLPVSASSDHRGDMSATTGSGRGRILAGPDFSEAGA
jgi:hypothetical protein